MKKEDRDRLGDKSKKVFGARGKWKKLTLTTGKTADELETFMDEQIELLEKGELVNERSSIKDNRKNRRRIQRLSRSKKIRSKQAENGTSTPKGSNTDG